MSERWKRETTELQTLMNRLLSTESSLVSELTASNRAVMPRDFKVSAAFSMCGKEEWKWKRFSSLRSAEASRTREEALLT
jgi:hypothetical protein